MDIFSRSVQKYEIITIEKYIMKLVKDFPVAEDEPIITAPQNIKTPTLSMFKANPFAAKPR
mgnify:CR=1 FL=1